MKTASYAVVICKPKQLFVVAVQLQEKYPESHTQLLGFLEEARVHQAVSARRELRGEVQSSEKSYMRVETREPQWES